MLKEIDVGFVILQYLCTKETVDCIYSILNNLDTDNFHIVIVDNASKNGSFEFIKEKFSDNAKITFIEESSNLGFAKGNNVGIKWLNNNFNSNYVCVINNDTILLEKEFIKKLNSNYKTSSFAVAGPKVITPDGNSTSNPKNIVFTKKSNIKKAIIKYNLKRFFSFFYVLRLYEIIARFLFHPPHKSIDKIDLKPYDAIMLHGCFLIFSKAYFNFYYGFDENTFLYLEEDILKYLCDQKKLKMTYISEICILHNEDSSTNMGHKSKRSKLLFKYTEMLKSLHYFLSIFRDEVYKENSERL